MLYKNNKIPNINARDFATILGLNPYQTAYELLEDKIEKKHLFFGNKFTDHGIRYENLAIKSFEKYIGLCINDEQVKVTHSEHNWITGRLDGILQEEEEKGGKRKRYKQLCVIEVKCPLKDDRVDELNEDNVPIQYWCQCQVYMNLIDCDFAYYIEYYIKPNDDPKNAKLYTVKIRRNKDWWNVSLPKIILFYEEIKFYHEKKSLDTHPVRITENKWKNKSG